MGNKSGRTGKHILLYLAVGCITTAANMIACAPIQDKIAEMRAQQRLEQYRENLAAGRFETIIQQSEEILSRNQTEPPADVAFYSLGEVYAHQDYAGRDYERAQYYFEQLLQNFPDSPLTAEGKIFISLFSTIAAQEKAAAEEQKVLENLPPPPKPHKVVENHKFEEAVQKNLLVVKKAGPKKPSDEALYNLGLIYADVDNPGKDYKKSQIYFHALLKQFPDSEYAEEARIWLGLFKTIEKMQMIDIEIEQQKKQLIR